MQKFKQKGGRQTQTQKLKDEKQCLWKGNMGLEGGIILKYDNEAEEKNKKRNHYGKRISPSCPSLHCIQIGHLQKRKGRASRGQEAGKRRQPRLSALVVENSSMQERPFGVNSSVQEKTFLMKGKGISLANEVPSVQAPSCTRCILVSSQPAVV